MELGELAGRDVTGVDPHRPAIDEVTIPCPTCGATATRVPEVIDTWYDSGAMPFAQWGYHPDLGRGIDAFERSFPADFISEAIDQTRGWFYTLMAEGVLHFDASAYRSVVCVGHIVAEDGRKMSKSLGQHLRSVGGARPAGRGRAPLVDADDRVAVGAAPDRPRHPRRRRPAVPPDALERLRVLRHVRERRRLRSGRRRRCRVAGERRWIGHGPVDPFAPGRHRARGARSARGLRRDRRRPSDRVVRRRPVELVRAPVPAPLLEPRRRGVGGCARRVRDPPPVPRDRRATPRAVHAVPERGDVAQPRRRSGRQPRLRPPQRLPHRRWRATRTPRSKRR